MPSSCVVPSANWLRALTQLVRSFATVCHDAGLVAGRPPFTGRIPLAGPTDAVVRLQALAAHLATFRAEPHVGRSPDATHEMLRYHRVLCEVVQATLDAWGIRTPLEGLGSIRVTVEGAAGRVDRVGYWDGGPVVATATVRVPLPAVAEYDVATLQACASGVDRILAEGPVIDRLLNPRDGDDVRDLVFVADHDAVYVDERDLQPPAASSAPPTGREGTDTAFAYAEPTPGPRNPLAVTEVDGRPVLRLLRAGAPPLELPDLAPGEYAVLDALRRAFPGQVGRDRFADLAGVADPGRELSRAATRYPALVKALVRPSKSSKRQAGRYGLSPLQVA